MVKPTFELSEHDYLEDFFEDGKLYGIQSKMEAYTFCAIVNKKLNYKFKASPENLLQKQYSSGNSGFDLFSSIEAFFPVYINEMPPCITKMIFYNNKHDNLYLVDDLKQYNYLLLVFNEEMLLYEDTLLNMLNTLDCIDLIEEVSIRTIDEIENLSI